MFQSPDDITASKCNFRRRRCSPQRTYITYRHLSPFNNLVFQTAIGVSANYDAIVDLFECVGNFLGRLGIYAELPMSPPMNEFVIKILAEVLSVLSLATKQIKQGRVSKRLTIYNFLVSNFAQKGSPRNC
jgi:hypothetical protein